MEASISIIHPKIILVATMETMEDIITGHFFVFTKFSPSGNSIAGVEIDCYWFDTSVWERDIRHNLRQIIEAKDIIVECRMMGPRHTHASETERRIREVLCNILGINDR